MKFMKLALLGTAALAAVSVTARADDLADLKAQIEALKADVANLQAAPSVPAGYSLMTVGEAASIVVPTLEANKFEYAPVANNIGVLPTADMPASTNIQWSGFVRAALVYSSVDGSSFEGTATTVATDSAFLDDSEWHLPARAELKVVGTTDTAVGEVGVMVKLRGEFDAAGNATVTSPEAWGWWKMTPELTFGGGYTGSLATINHAADNMTQMYGGGLLAGPYGFGDRTQFRLSYASGPLSAAVALTHSDATYGHYNSAAAVTSFNTTGEFGAEAEIKYAGDMFSAELAGGILDNNQWKIGAGVSASLSDMFRVELGGQIGSSEVDNIDTVLHNWGRDDADTDYWTISALVVAALSDSVSLELGASYAEWDGSLAGTANQFSPGDAASIDGSTAGVAAGLYYTPVSQLTLGLEASYNESEESVLDAAGNWTDESVDTTTAAFVSVFRF